MAHPVKPVTLAVAALFSCLGIAEAQSAETVLTNTATQTCFDAARFQSAARPGVDACTAALDSDALSREDRAATLINRGILKMRLSDSLGAISDFNAGLALSPGLADAYVDRGALLIQIKRYSDAMQDLSKGITLGSQKANVAYYDRGLVRERTGDLAGACDDYRHALVLQPDFVLARNQLAGCPAAMPPKHSGMYTGRQLTG